METIAKGIQTVDAQVIEINNRIKDLENEAKGLRSKVSKILKKNNYKIKSSNEVIIQSAHNMVNDVVNALPEISKEKLLSPCRDSEIVLTRQCIGYILHNKYGLSLTSIGNILDRNHATIIHGNKTVEIALYLYQNHKDSRSREILNYLNDIGLVMGLTEKIN